MDPVVILGSETVSAGPGQEARLPVRIRNQGRRVESYRIDVVGDAARFSQVDPPTVSVLPGREAQVDITFRPPVGSSTPTGTLPFAVRATSDVDAGSSAVAEGRLELEGVAGLQAWAESTAGSGRWSARYQVRFANQGNAPVRLAVSAHDPAAAIGLLVADDTIDLQAGATAGTEVRAKVRRPFLRGTPVNRIFQVSCQHFPFGAVRPVPVQGPVPDDPYHRTFQLTFQQKPILSKVAIAAIVIVVAALAALVFFRFRGEEERALGLAAPEAPPGLVATESGSSTILLEWEPVPNAVGYAVSETTADGQPSGPALVQGLGVEVNIFPVENLDAETTYCFTVVAEGTEETGNSQSNPFECATTAAESRLTAPTDLVVESLGNGSFDLSWTYPPAQAADVVFAVFVDGKQQPDIIAETSTSIALTRNEDAYDTTIAVRAVRGDERSDPTNTETVTVEALPPSTVPVVVTTAPVGAPTTVPVGTPTTVPGGTPTPTTTATPAVTTTTAPGTTATTIVSPAQTELQDLEQRWVAVIGAVVPGPGAIGEEAQRSDLAAQYEIAPAAVKTFSNRDTLVTDGSGALEPTVAAGTPDVIFFYVEQLDGDAAETFCQRDPTNCRPARLQGAASAAAGSDIVVLRRFQDTTPLRDIDEAVGSLRTGLGRDSVYAVGGRRRPQFPPNAVVIYASGFTGADDIAAFCAANATTQSINPCQAERLLPAR